MENKTPQEVTQDEDKLDAVKENEAIEEILNGQTLLNLAPKLDRLWIFYPHLLKLNTLMLGPLLAQIVVGYDGSMMNGLQAVSVWQEFFNHPSGGRLGTMSNGITIGSLITFPFSPYIVDFLGRKKSLLLACVIIVAGAVLQGAGQNFSAFLGARILLGMGAHLSSVSSAPLITECTYPTHRTVVTSMFQGSWPVGSFIAALVTRASFTSSTLKDSNWSWRIPSLLQGLLPLVQFFVTIFGPESPRWLVDKGRTEEARAFFVKYHANGDENHVLVAAQMAEISAAIEAEKLQKASKWTQWFKSRGMRKRFFVVAFTPAMFQLEGNALISYYLHIILDSIGIKDSIKQLNINLGLTVYSLFTSIGMAFLADSFKRKTLLLTGLSTMLVNYVIWTILSAVGQQHNWVNKSLSIGVIVFIYLYQGFYHIGSCIQWAYIMELSPYSLRAKGAAMNQLMSSLAGLFNNYVNPIAMVAIQWKYYIVYDIWLAVLMGIVYFLYPETHGVALEEVDDLFNTDDLGARNGLRHYFGIQSRDDKPATEHAEQA